MRRFKFRLESVLRLRRFELDRLRLQWRRLDEMRRECESELVAARGRLATGRSLLEASARAGSDGALLSIRAQGVTMGELGVKHASDALAEIEPRVAEALVRVQQAGARVKSLEKMREREEARHRAETLAQEQAELEDLSASRVGTRAQAAGRAGRVAS